MILRPMIEIEKKDVLEYLEKNNMQKIAQTVKMIIQGIRLEM